MSGTSHHPDEAAVGVHQDDNKLQEHLAAYRELMKEQPRRHTTQQLAEERARVKAVAVAKQQEELCRLREENYGANRPICSDEQRKAMLAKLRAKELQRNMEEDRALKGKTWSGSRPPALMGLDVKRQRMTLPQAINKNINLPPSITHQLGNFYRRPDQNPQSANHPARPSTPISPPSQTFSDMFTPPYLKAKPGELSDQGGAAAGQVWRNPDWWFRQPGVIKSAESVKPEVCGTTTSAVVSSGDASMTDIHQQIPSNKGDIKMLYTWTTDKPSRLTHERMVDTCNFIPHSRDAVKIDAIRDMNMTGVEYNGKISMEEGKSVPCSNITDLESSEEESESGVCLLQQDFVPDSWEDNISDLELDPTEQSTATKSVPSVPVCSTPYHKEEENSVRESEDDDSKHANLTSLQHKNMKWQVRRQTLKQNSNDNKEDSEGNSISSGTNITGQNVSLEELDSIWAVINSDNGNMSETNAKTDSDKWPQPSNVSNKFYCKTKITATLDSLKVPKNSAMVSSTDVPQSPTTNQNDKSSFASNLAANSVQGPDNRTKRNSNQISLFDQRRIEAQNNAQINYLYAELPPLCRTSPPNSVLKQNDVNSETKDNNSVSEDTGIEEKTDTFTESEAAINLHKPIYSSESEITQNFPKPAKASGAHWTSEIPWTSKEPETSQIGLTVTSEAPSTSGISRASTSTEPPGSSQTEADLRALYLLNLQRQQQLLLMSAQLQAKMALLNTQLGQTSLTEKNVPTVSIANPENTYLSQNVGQLPYGLSLPAQARVKPFNPPPSSLPQSLPPPINAPLGGMPPQLAVGNQLGMGNVQAQILDPSMFPAQQQMPNAQTYSGNYQLPGLSQSVTMLPAQQQMPNDKTYLGNYQLPAMTNQLARANHAPSHHHSVPAPPTFNFPSAGIDPTPLQPCSPPSHYLYPQEPDPTLPEISDEQIEKILNSFSTISHGSSTTNKVSSKANRPQVNKLSTNPVPQPASNPVRSGSRREVRSSELSEDKLMRILRHVPQAVEDPDVEIWDEQSSGVESLGPSTSLVVKPGRSFTKASPVQRLASDKQEENFVPLRKPKSTSQCDTRPRASLTGTPEVTSSFNSSCFNEKSSQHWSQGDKMGKPETVGPVDEQLKVKAVETMTRRHASLRSAAPTNNSSSGLLSLPAGKKIRRQYHPTPHLLQQAVLDVKRDVRPGSDRQNASSDYRMKATAISKDHSASGSSVKEPFNFKTFNFGAYTKKIPLLDSLSESRNS